MKRFFYLVMIITLPVVAFFQFWNFRKFNPPTDYAYESSEDIDPNYHDPELVKRYYLTCEEVGTYARYIWKEHRVDVKFASLTDPDEQKFGKIYNSLIASAQFLEKKLEKSSELKQNGLSNVDIKRWELGLPKETPAAGVTTKNPQQKDTDINPIIAQIGDRSAAIKEIQQQLYKIGHNIKIDGIFREETKEAVLAYQKKNKLPETGFIDIETFLKLMK